MFSFPSKVYYRSSLSSKVLARKVLTFHCFLPFCFSICVLGCSSSFLFPFWFFFSLCAPLCWGFLSASHLVPVKLVDIMAKFSYYCLSSDRKCRVKIDINLHLLCPQGCYSWWPFLYYALNMASYTFFSLKCDNFGPFFQKNRLDNSQERPPLPFLLCFSPNGENSPQKEPCHQHYSNFVYHKWKTCQGILNCLSTSFQFFYKWNGMETNIP